MAAGALLLLLLLCVMPHSAAQDVPTLNQPESYFYSFDVNCDPSFIELKYLGSARYSCAARDMSADTASPPGEERTGPYATLHTVTLEEVGVEPLDAKGWKLDIGMPSVPIRAGETVPLPIEIKTLPDINTARVTYHVLATFEGPNGYVSTKNLTLSAQVMRYDFAEVRMQDKVRNVGQDENIYFTVLVTNHAVYPDIIEFMVTSEDPGFQVTTPAGIYVPALSSRNITIGVQTPNDKVYELGRNTLISVRASSTTGSGVYYTNGQITVRGGYLPVHWIPLVIVGLVSAAVVVRRSKERMEIGRMEKGRPRRVEPTPRQAVLLGELKRRDPDAYRERTTAMQAVYKERRAAWLAAYRQRKKADQVEARQARLEYKEAIKRRKAEEKAQRAQEKRDAKARKILERKEAKIRRKKEKELKKKRKLLEKRKSKADKRQAKLDAKEAKRQAKEEAKAAKAQAKAEKAARKAAKKRPPGGNP